MSLYGAAIFNAAGGQPRPDRPPVVCLPGILARADEQFGPLMPLLTRNYTVMGYDYAGQQFDADELIRSASKLVSALVQSGVQVTLLGASMGGMIVPFVIKRLSRETRQAVRVVIVDAPSGAETISALPSWAAHGITAFRPGTVTNATIGKLIMKIMMMPPKRDMITVPSDMALQPLASEEYKDWVIATARRHLSGHLFSMWWSQLAWMIRVGRDGTLQDSCKSLIGERTTYVACMRGNDVVDQPQAMEWWRSHATGVKTLEVAATHCGFLQDQPIFATALKGVLEPN